MNYPILQTDINCDKTVKMENTNLLNNYRNVIIFPDNINFLFNPFDNISLAVVSKLKFTNANNIIIFQPSNQNTLIDQLDTTTSSSSSNNIYLTNQQPISTLTIAETDARVKIWNTYDNCDYVTLQLTGIVTSKTQNVNFNNTIYLNQTNGEYKLIIIPEQKNSGYLKITYYSDNYVYTIVSISIFLGEDGLT